MPGMMKIAWRRGFKHGAKGKRKLGRSTLVPDKASQSAFMRGQSCHCGNWPCTPTRIDAPSQGDVRVDNVTWGAGNGDTGTSETLTIPIPRLVVAE